MDAEAWEFASHNMGVFALLRNLRNFDQKGISEAAVNAIIQKLTDPKEVESSRIFPYHVYVAYREAPSDNWKRALSKTLDLACANIPELMGRTLVLVDVSGSMQGRMSGKSKVMRLEVASVMAAALAKFNTSDIVPFGTRSMMMDVTPGTSALRIAEQVVDIHKTGRLDYGTNIHTAIRDHFDSEKHKRVIVFTDDQAMDSGSVNLSHVPLIYTFDLAGYGRSTQQNGTNGRFSFGGFSDSALSAIPVLERGRDGSWPF
jgi:hypothetical protein